MTEPDNTAGQANRDIDAWRRILATPTVLDVLAGHVDDWSPVPAEDAAWLTHTPLPVAWQIVPVVEDAPIPLRVAALAVDGRPYPVACQSLSAFRFTGAPATELLSENSDRALRAFGAEGIRSDLVILPERPGLAGVRSGGYVAVDGQRMHVRYSMFLSGSDEPLQGLVVEEIVVAAAENYFQLGKDIGALSGATKDAFTAHIGLSAAESDTAVAAHGERLRAQVNQGPVLLDDQQRFLSTALAMWGGVASNPPLLTTRLLGYADRQEFESAVAGLRAELDRTTPHFSAADWTRILILAEIAFASDVLGAGVEFEIVSAWRDPEALSLLRSVQRALGPYVDASLVFEGDLFEGAE